MKIVTLGSVAKFIRGVTFKPGEVVDAHCPEAVGVVRTKNVQQELDLRDVVYIPDDLVGREDQLIQRDDILVSSANSWNLVGKCCWVPRLADRYAIGGFITGLRVTSEEVHPRYLYLWLASQRVQAELRNTANQTTNIANLNLKRCEQLPLPLPPLDEQRRIAAILDQADGLRDKSRRVAASLDGLAKSLFECTFGTVDSSWPTVSLSELFLDAQVGLVRNTKEIGSEHPHRYVRMDAIGATGNYLAQKEVRTSASAAELSRYSLKSGDLIFNTRNSRELVGKSAIFRGEPALYNNNVLRIRLRNDMVRPEYIHGFLWSPVGQQELDQRKSGTTSVFAVYQKNLATIPVPLPPVDLQQSYVETLNVIHQNAAKSSVRDERLDELLLGLQSGAFMGVAGGIGNV